ncbi:hypothetical protein CTEN210_06584 [Chaetoceros tenuissimus]|uniref:histone acetyltransferase n=1 Tax=Chaetoceros tenuissimus TaxID=426638 RepID=A0AAD3CQ55_9STRA|nr:hypothetical protein CTEN210_06584 [Chaetoceros tenuissimus]
MLKFSTDNGFVNLPAKIREANPMQADSNASGEAVNSERIEIDIVDGSKPPPQPISITSMTVGKKRNCSDSQNQREKRVRTKSTTSTLLNSLSKNQIELHIKSLTEARVRGICGEVLSKEEELRRSDNACTLCGYGKLQFQHTVIFCSGKACHKRIHRNRIYYTDGKQCNWCTSCYKKLDDTKTKDLVDKKNNATNEESWVKCDECDGWMHQICGLFNPRQNKNDDSVKFSCPTCLLKERKEREIQPDTWYPRAEDLPHTKSSEFLEKHVTKKLQKKFEELALGKAQTENIHLAEAIKKVQTGGKITIRQVSAIDEKLVVNERMLNRYKHMNYPEEFKYRSKCILVFQNLDGVDVLLFAFYVYEHDERNPAPNTGTVYISYLDSVNYMAPRHLRSFVYHEILISYLDYARQRGYATAHIWACPPKKGDDYIFHGKPEDQKTPKESRLRQWYVDMLVEAQKRNIVGTVTNMYELYFVKGSDATIVPYFQGDYFSGEIESFIKKVEDWESKGKGIENDLINADDSKPCDTSNDKVMKRFGNSIKSMKDSFIVACLNWSGAKAEHMKVPKVIEEERERRKKEECAPTIQDGPTQFEEDRLVRIIDDDSEDLQCDIFNFRQDFLNLCTKNHYQFDQLRRAKHTTMMLLSHLHNSNAAEKCSECSKDIGGRTETCTCFEFCDESNKHPSTDQGACTHKLVPLGCRSRPLGRV